jgi:predicted 3-demethylubiquinone-9 3-methyltransferase (glyoxalase superfamily)
VCPDELGALMADPDPERAERAFAAMLSMEKIDIAAIRAAADGADTTAPSVS